MRELRIRRFMRFRLELDQTASRKSLHFVRYYNYYLTNKSDLYTLIHGKKNFAEILKNLAKYIYINLKIILFNYQNNYVERSI